MVVTVLKDDETIAEEQWETGTSEKGYFCDHAVIDQEHYDDDKRKPCGWCVSQGNSGVWQETEVISCDRCGDLYKTEDIVHHWLHECGVE